MKPAASPASPSGPRPHATGGGRARARAVGPGDRLAVHHADDRPAAGDQHLPAALDDPPLVHQLPRQPAERAHPVAGPAQLRARADRPGHLAQHAGHGPFRAVDHRHPDPDRLHPGLSGQPALPQPWLLDDGHPAADDAVAGRGRQFLDLPVPAADRPVQLLHLVLHRHRPVLVPDDRRRQPGALVDHHRRYLDVGALRDADLPGRPALDPRLHLRGGRGRPCLAVAAVLVDHAADGAAVHHAGGAVPRRSRTSRCSIWWSS